MTAIAGVMSTGEFARVADMLDRLNHRGQAGRAIVDTGQATIGVAWRPGEPNPTEELERTRTSATRAPMGAWPR